MCVLVLVFDRNGIFAETPKYISVKIGFSAEIIRFRPKLFGFRCFGRLVSVPKEPKSAESAEMPKPKHYSVEHYLILTQEQRAVALMKIV